VVAKLLVAEAAERGAVPSVDSLDSLGPSLNQDAEVVPEAFWDSEELLPPEYCIVGEPDRDPDGEPGSEI